MWLTKEALALLMVLDHRLQACTKELQNVEFAGVSILGVMVFILDILCILWMEPLYF